MKSDLKCYTVQISSTNNSLLHSSSGNCKMKGVETLFVMKHQVGPAGIQQHSNDIQRSSLEVDSVMERSVSIWILLDFKKMVCLFSILMYRKNYKTLKLKPHPPLIKRREQSVNWLDTAMCSAVFPQSVWRSKLALLSIRILRTSTLHLKCESTHY